MEAIQSLTAKKIRELLALCEIGDHSHEPISPYILEISQFVHKTRLHAGKKGPPACLIYGDGSNALASTNEIRGSYRLKRGPVDYSGLDGPSQKTTRRTKCRTRVTALDAPTKSSTANNDGPACCPDVPDQSTTDDTLTSSKLAAPMAITGPTVLEAGMQHAAASGTSAANDSTLAETHSTKATSASRAVPSLSSDVECINLLHPQASMLFDMLGSACGMKVMDTILIDCVKLNYARGKENDKDKYVEVRMRTERIRSLAEKIVGSEYDSAMRILKKENSISASKHIQARYNEAIYWDIIKNGASLLDPAKLPPMKGRPTGFSMAEKVATERFMVEAGIETSYTSQRYCRRLWKSLSDMRKVGVDKLLFYRTKEFDRFCAEYPADTEATLTETVQLWEKVYGPYIEQLESRVVEESGGDLNGKSWLQRPYVAERLDVPERSWNSAKNVWHSDAEEKDLSSTSGPVEASCDQLQGLFDISPIAGGNRNKSIFVTLLPRGEKLLSVCSIFTIQEGDFLGVFAGKIRCSESFDATYGIRGPGEKLWLDYSEMTGVLNLMRVSPPDGRANVDLRWELFNDNEGKGSRVAWRISVRAIRSIKPFEEFIRAAPQSEQYTLHQDHARARRSFLKSGEADCSHVGGA